MALGSSSIYDHGVDEAHNPNRIDNLPRGRNGCGAILQEPSGEREQQGASRRAKTSFVKKCKRDNCAGKAVSAEGKPLHGAAKNSFMRKCMTTA